MSNIHRSKARLPLGHEISGVIKEGQYTALQHNPMLMLLLLLLQHSHMIKFILMPILLMFLHCCCVRVDLDLAVPSNFGYFSFRKIVLDCSHSDVCFFPIVVSALAVGPNANLFNVGDEVVGKSML